MATYQGLRNSNASSFPTNNNELITASILRAYNEQVIDQLGELQTRGVATPASSPGAINGPASWFASVPGIYSNFGAQTVGANEIKYIKNDGDGNWSSETIADLSTIGFISAVNDSDSVNLDVLNNTLTADVVVSTLSTNDIQVLTLNPGGLYLDVSTSPILDTHDILGGGVVDQDLQDMIDELASGGVGGGLWSEDGADIYRLSQIGVGLNDPKAGIHVLNGIRLGDFGAASTWLFPTSGANYTVLNDSGQNLTYYTYNASSGNQNNFNFTGGPCAATSGVTNVVSMLRSFSPTSGNASFTIFNVNGTINQTGTASGVTKGVSISPNISSALNWRALEIGTNVGFSIYQTGSSSINYFAGRVGIGTSGPTATIELKSDSLTQVLRNVVDNEIVFRNNTTNGTRLDIASGSTYSPTFINVGDLIGGSEYMSFSKTLFQLYNNKFTVLSGGDVGIGSTSPDARLHIVKDTSQVAVFESTSANNATYYFNSSTGSTIDSDGLTIGNIGVDARFWNYENADIYFGTNSAERIRIKASGNVGIAQNTPLEKLHVSGNIRQDLVSTDVYYKFGTNDLIFESLNDRKIYFNDSGGSSALIIDTFNGDITPGSILLDNGTAAKNVLKKTSVGAGIQIGSTTLTDWSHIYMAQNTVIGSATNTAEAILELVATDKALLITKMTTTQRNAMTATNGMIIYNTTDDEFQGYKAGAWSNL